MSTGFILLACLSFICLTEARPKTPGCVCPTKETSNEEKQLWDMLSQEDEEVYPGILSPLASCEECSEIPIEIEREKRKASTEDIEELEEIEESLKPKTEVKRNIISGCPSGYKALHLHSRSRQHFICVQGF